MMPQLQKTAPDDPFLVRAPEVPSTLVLAENSFAVSVETASELAALGWDVRVKPGAVHVLHLQDPAGFAAFIDDVLVDRPAT